MNTFSRFGPGVDTGLEDHSWRRVRELALVNAASPVSRLILRFGGAVIAFSAFSASLLSLPPLLPLGISVVGNRCRKLTVCATLIY